MQGWEGAPQCMMGQAAVQDGVDRIAVQERLRLSVGCTPENRVVHPIALQGGSRLSGISHDGRGDREISRSAGILCMCIPFVC